MGHFAARRIFAALAFWAAIGAFSTANAHTFAPALLLLREQSPDVFAVRFELPPGREVTPEVEPRWPASCRFERAPSLLRCAPGALDGARVEFAAEVDAEILIRVERLDGRKLSGAVERGGSEFIFPAATARARVPWQYGALGFTHILVGIDHLLFLLGLTLLIRKRRALALALTAFTLGHSATLALATLGVVSIPSPPVEALIALSLILVALDLVRGDELSALRRRPALLAFAFGLVHGLGFAGALAQLGLPHGAIPLALLTFNLGVEVGQLAFVTALLLIAALLRRLMLQRKIIQQLPAYALGSLGCALFIERVLAFFEVAR